MVAEKINVPEKFLFIEGGKRLVGEVQVAGAKNSVLKLFAAALLAEGTTVIKNCPQILDVSMMTKVLEGVGAVVKIMGDTTSITVPKRLNPNADINAVRKLRASICVLGPLLVRCGKAKVALPGGDAIGSRPLDMHQSALRQLGVEVNINKGVIIAQADQLVGGYIKLDFPSNGATETVLLTSVLAKGTTVLDNAAREPEIVDLCELLIAMGAKISGVGTSTITIVGVEKLSPAIHVTVGDRIVAATWGFAAAITQGDITVTGVNPNHLAIVLEKFSKVGALITSFSNGFRILQPKRATSIKISTLPFPGYPTDLQPMAMSLAAISVGTSVITENIFESRFRFVEEILRLGADIQIEGHHALIRGKMELCGTEVQCHDIRAGAALAIIALAAKGITKLSEIYHIERGYPNFLATLNSLGARAWEA